MKQVSRNASVNRQHPILQRLQEVLVIFGFFVTAYLTISLLTYHRLDSGWSTTGSGIHIANAGGRLGAFTADVLLYGFGYYAFLFPVAIAYFSRLFYTGKKASIPHDYRIVTLRTFGFMLLVISGTGLANILITPWPGMPFTSGGITGELLDLQLKIWLNPVGTILVLWPLLLVGISLFSGISWVNIMDKIGHILLKITGYLISQALLLAKKTQRTTLIEEIEPVATTIPEPTMNKRIAKQLPRVAPKTVTEKKETIALPTLSDDKKITAENSILEESVVSLKLVQSQDMIEAENNSLPPLHLLDPAPPASDKRYSNSTLETMSREVELRLIDFGVQAKVVAVHPGPVITRFELSLAPGVKVSKISNLAKDLARSLSVVSVRIVEVIPGKAVIGLEVPNEHRELVYLSEILASNAFEKSHSPLSLALGKDISGHSVVVDLAKMPHLLVAGTTGSGKSVGLNVMLLSLLYKASPEKVRMIMIDPKMLELSIYDGIPHLLAPVVTDMKEAANALRWCVAEMERRYRLMASLGVRNLAGYNQKIEDGLEKNTPILNPLPPLLPQHIPEPLNPLPYIVVVIDEFADMMMVVGKKVEELIARIAQKARAAGIHMILATQRPSVDVITGLIKANIPTRIAFQVSSRIDSRTILDQQGAEQLLGYGDMLYLAAGTGIPVRVHGAYAADHEVHAVANYLKQQAKPDYLLEILESEENNNETQTREQTGGEQDPLYDQAVQIVLQTRRASVSNIQRRLKIGYNRAARIVEDMEAAGMVSAMGSNGNREVLVENLEEVT